MSKRQRSSRLLIRHLFGSVFIVASLSVIAIASGWSVGLSPLNLFVPSTRTISGNIQQYNFPSANTDLAGVTVTLSGDGAGTSTTDASGNYSFTGLATGGSYLVTPELAGYTFDPGSRSYTNVTVDVTAADFTGYTAGSPRVISVVSQNVVPGNQVVVPVTLESLGNENSLGFTVSYDQAVLSSPVVAVGADCGGCAPYLIVNSATLGKVGIIVARPTGLVFAAGTRQVVTITFNTVLAPPAFSTPVGFGDTPVLREVNSPNADPLFATYAAGAVTFVAATRTISGNIQQYNFPSANTDLAGVTVTLSGDGAGTSTTDASGNYSFTGLATGGSYLVTPELAGYTFDPGSRSYTNVTVDVTAADFTGYTAGSPRVISVVSQNVVPGNQVVVPVTLESLGNENSLGFTVSYDQAVLSSPVVAVGADCGGCAPYLIVNSATLGKVGIIVARPTGLVFAAGTRQVVTITFNTVLAPPAFSTPVGFGDTPVLREVNSPNADPLFATYAAGAVTFVAATRTISGNIQQYNFPSANTDLAGVTVTLSGDGAGTSTTDASGNYSFTGLATSGSYLVTPELAGYTFDPGSRSYTNVTVDVTAADFTGYTAGSPRVISVVSQNVVPGNQVVVPVTLESLGNENSLGFTVSYDQAVLSSPVVAVGADCGGCAPYLIVNSATLGKVGIIVARPTGLVFAAGTRQVVTITFNTVLAPPAFSTPVGFGDTPVLREVNSPNADPLFATYAAGAVTFVAGYESDVAPRFNGDGAVTVTDYVQTGLFAAGLDTPNPLTNEFQRADSAPIDTRGDGFITVTDYIQAGRYAAGFDPLVAAGGPTVASLFSINEVIKQQEQGLSLLPRVISAADVSTSAGQQVTVSIQIAANGDENGFGFTISYDGTKLSNPVVTTGADMPFSGPIANTLTAGKVGVITALPTLSTMPAGTREIVKIRFNVSPTAPAGTTPITFTGFPPVVNQVSDASAGVLATTFTAGTVTITAPTAAGTSVGGIVLTADGLPVRNARLSMTDTAGTVRTAISNAFGFYRFDDVTVGETYVVSIQARNFVFTPRVLTVAEEVTNMNFVAEP